jgi:hypothetical protein
MANAALQKVWRGRLKSYAQSKQTVRAWCAQHDVPVHQFNYWRRQLSVSSLQSKPSDDKWLALAVSPEPTAVPKPTVVPTSGRLPVAPGGVAIRMGEAVIEVSPGFDGDLLRAVVQALESAPC